MLKKGEPWEVAATDGRRDESDDMVYSGFGKDRKLSGNGEEVVEEDK